MQAEHKDRDSPLSAKRQRNDESKRGRPSRSGSAPSRKRAAAVTLRRAGSSDEYELVLPPCAQERADDLDEVYGMLDEGEAEVATDELRWLLADCPDFLDAHQLLGELALVEGDTRLARGHFGYAYDLGLAALPAPDFRGTLPFRLPANRGFLTAAKGLAHCLRELAEVDRAREVAERLIAFDPSDPLGVRAWLAQTASADATGTVEKDGPR